MKTFNLLIVFEKTEIDGFVNILYYIARLDNFLGML